jgi:hypothetical protein
MGTTAIAASPDKAMLWAPRLLAAAISLFLATLSLDAFRGGTLTEDLPDFLIHLIPAAICLGIIAIAWHREWIGAAAFCGLSVAYAVIARSHPLWIATISGPLLVVGLLYWWNWSHRQGVS